MKKKVFAVLLAAISCLAVPVTAIAEEAEQAITVNLTADPTYTVTIPASVSMDKEGTAVEGSGRGRRKPAGGTENFRDHCRNQWYNDQMVVEAKTTPRTSLRYQIISDAGELIETNASTGAVGVGKEVVSFTGDGAKQYQIKPVLAGRFEYGVDYTGSITFGIEVVDVQ